MSLIQERFYFVPQPLLIAIFFKMQITSFLKDHTKYEKQLHFIHFSYNHGSVPSALHFLQTPTKNVQVSQV